MSNDIPYWNINAKSVDVMAFGKANHYICKFIIKTAIIQIILLKIWIICVQIAILKQRVIAAAKIVLTRMSNHSLTYAGVAELA